MEESWDNCDPPDLSTIVYTVPVQLGWGPLQHKHCGLLNYGNSCYLNASIQALMHVPAFINFLEKESVHRSTCNKEDCIVCALYKTLNQMRESSILANKPVISKLAVINQRMSVYKQEDAHEFLQALLDAIAEQELQRFSFKFPFCARQTTGMGSIFGLWVKEKRVCKTCLETRVFFSCQTYIMVPTCESSVQKGLIKVFQEQEEVTEFTCSKCPPFLKSKGACTKSLQLHLVPKVLIVVIDRFDRATKIKDQSPLIIDQQLEIGFLKYSLLSGVVHHGTEINSGHYTCISKCPDGSFTKYDDHKVTLEPNYLDTLECLTGMYIVLYELDAKSLPKRPRPASLTKLSPAPKKLKSPFEKRLYGRMPSHLSPSKRSPSKRRSLFGVKELKAADDDGFLALPLSNEDAQDELEEVPPLTINRRRRVNPKESDSQSSHEYCIAKPGAKVPPVVMKVRQRVRPKETPSESSHEYSIIRADKKVQPVIINIKPRPMPKETASQSSHEYSILRKDVVLDSSEKVKGQDDFDHHSDSDIFSESHEHNPASPHDVCHENRSEKKVLPVIINIKPRPMPKETASQSSHEYSILRKDVLLDGSEKVKGQDDFDHRSDIFNESHENNPASPHENLNLTVGDGSEFNSYSPQRGVMPTHNEIEGNIVLSEDDVPGAKLPKQIVEVNLLRDLRRWLVCHGQDSKGTKAVLIDRIRDCMGRPNPPGVRQNVDQGEWLRRKLDRLRMQNNQQAVFPDDGFGTFPSIDLPKNFNFGSVFHYIIETRPTLEAEDSDDAEESSDEEAAEEVTVNDPFKDPQCKELLRAKPFRRGLIYVKSGWIKGLQDCADERNHYIKAHVRASMDPEAYWVYVTISCITGGVCQVTCGYPCPATSNGRCSHASGVLLQILAHIHLNGYEAIMCTSRPCEWNRGSLKHSPSIVTEKQYASFKINIKRRAYFDPRPTEFKEGLTRKQIDDFLSALSYKEVDCYWQRHMSIVYEDFDFSGEDLEILKGYRTEFCASLKSKVDELKPHPTYKGPFEVKGTEGQSSSEVWISLRSLHCTGSCAKLICHMNTSNAMRRFLRQHLWGLDKFTSKATRYGSKNEPIARRKYLEEQRKNDQSVTVRTTGLHLNTEFIGLSCSLDGQVFSSKNPPHSLEIKCPYTLRNHDPNNFDEILSRKQLSKFCLMREKDGTIGLKKDHDYVYQVQMGMGMLGYSSCDLFVWSEHGHITIPVSFDPAKWAEIKEKMTDFHYRKLVPEYFAMKTPRKLAPITLED